MLTEKQKKVLRLLIKQNPDPEYMKDLSENDDFACSEIEQNKASLKTNFQTLIDNYNSHITLIQQEITKLQAEIAIIDDLDA